MNLRLRAHNEGLSRHTSPHRPWRILVVIKFDEEEPALKFERYLKSPICLAHQTRGGKTLDDVF